LLVENAELSISIFTYPSKELHVCKEMNTQKLDYRQPWKGVKIWFRTMLFFKEKDPK
jgi:hypothetical protein